jgi:hypothetical protein
LLLADLPTAAGFYRMENGVLAGALTSFRRDAPRLWLKKKQPVTCWAHAWQATGCLMIVSTSPSSLRIRPLFKYYK